MLRNDSQVALNEVIVACQDTAEQYRSAAEMIEDKELAGFFEKNAQARKTTADLLGSHVRQRGDLPDAPDPDRETLESMITHIKSALSADERLPLLEKCQQDEQVILERTQVALERNLPEDTQSLLRNLQRDVTDALKRLTEGKARI